MLYIHSTEKLLALKDVIIKKVEENNEGNTEIHLEKSVKPHTCPICGESTNKVHDYRNQRIKDIPELGKKTVLILHKNRSKKLSKGSRNCVQFFSYHGAAII